MKGKAMSTRVLIVDDEQDTLTLFRIILELNGYTVITTLNSNDALGLIAKEQPDVVLLDIMMPGLDGFELCKLLRQNAATRALPVIFVTAYEALDLEERRIEAGADMIIHKPIDTRLMIATITEVIALHSLVDSI
jgi:two-component system, cell cycle response regulator